jgi:hypothetical protein
MNTGLPVTVFETKLKKYQYDQKTISCVFRFIG